MSVRGMLWYDEFVKAPLEERVARAIKQYEVLHGKVGKVCYIHPGMGLGNTRSLGDVKVISVKWILPNHILVCEE